MFIRKFQNTSDEKKLLDLSHEIYIYIYIYILSSTDRSILFYQNSSVWLDILDSHCWDRNPVESKRQSKTLPLSHEETSSKVNFKRLWITITIVYIHLLNGYQELNSYKEPCISLMATRLLLSLESSTLQG